MSKIISIANQKGGVGKSTTAVNLSSYLSLKRKKVLIIDIDPQGNATSGLGIEKNSISSTIYDVLIKDTPIEDVIKRTEMKNLDIIPSNIELAGAEIELVGSISRETKLKRAIEKIKHKYNYILIDCAPSLGLLTLNGLTASDSLIIPLQCEYYALEGISQLIKTIQIVKGNLNFSLEIEGVLLTMFDSRTRLSKQVKEEVENYFGEKVFKTIIPRNVKLSEAPSFGKPINLFAPESVGAKSYKKLAGELIKHG